MNTILTVEEVASELNLKPIGVKRLIARGKLDAARLGTSDQWRITRGALSKYTSNGLQDSEPPAVDERWFTDNFNFKVNQFEDDLMQAAGDQRISQDRVNTIAEATPEDQTASVDILLEISAPMRAVMGAPVPRVMPGDEKLYAQFKSRRDLYVVAMLREEALYVRSDIAKSPLERLYFSPEQYDLIVAQAASNFSAKKILLKESRTAFEGTIDQRQVTVTYLLEKGKLWNISDRPALIFAAF